MRIGVFAEGQEGLTWDRWFRLAEQVEALGLDSLWRSDHLFSLMGQFERPSLEAWTSLTALAQRTSRITFGPLVSPMTFRHPALLARMAAAVDVLSGGRLVLGVGAGWNEVEHAAFGIPLPALKERMDRLEEGVVAITSLWPGGPVTVSGRYYPLRGASLNPRPVQQPGPPLLIGGDGEVRLLRIVARYADEWNSHMPTPEAYRARRARLEEHCRAVGRDPDRIRRSRMCGVLIGSDPRDLERKTHWIKAFHTELAQVSPAKVQEYLQAKGWLLGTPEDITDQLSAWSAVGIERVMLQYYDLDDMDGLKLLAEVGRAVRVSP